MNDSTNNKPGQEIGHSSSPMIDRVIQNSAHNNVSTTSVQEALNAKWTDKPVTGTGTAGAK